MAAKSWNRTINFRKFCAKPTEVRRALGISAEKINEHLAAVDSGVGELKDLNGEGVFVYKLSTKSNKTGWWMARAYSEQSLDSFLDVVYGLRQNREAFL